MIFVYTIYMVIRQDVGQYTRPKRKALKIILLSLLAVILGIGIWVGGTAYKALTQVTSLSGANGNVFSFFSNNQANLKGVSEGRTNILILGMGGSNHPGGTLSDTILVMSIEWKTKKVAMISVPRDLWVNIPGHGASKINEAHSYGEQNAKTTGGGGKVASDVVSQVLGLPIHYFVSVDFDGFKKIIDTVGGIDVVVEKDLYDPYYPADNMIDYSPFRITAGNHHLDGAMALKYARSRETTSDFDRSKRQQIVIAALKQKLLTVDILANPKKLTDLMTILGKHIRTNMSVGDIKTFWDSIKDLDMANIINKVLDTSTGSPLISSTSNAGAYIIVPKKGIGVFTDLQMIAKNIFEPTATSTATTSDITSLKIEVLNGSGKSGEGTIAADQLKKAGYTITSVANTTKTAKSIVYNCGGLTTQNTAAKIAEELGATTATKTACGTVDIEVIIGQDALAR